MGYLPSLVLLINMYTIVEGRIGARVPTVKTTSFELNKKTLLLLFFINCWNEIGHNVSVSNSLFLPCFFFFFCIIIFLLAHAHPPPPLFPSSVRIKCKQKQLGSGYSMRFLSRRPHGRNIRSRFLIFFFTEISCEKRQQNCGKTQAAVPKENRRLFDRKFHRGRKSTTTKKRRTIKRRRRRRRSDKNIEAV